MPADLVDVPSGLLGLVAGAGAGPAVARVVERILERYRTERGTECSDTGHRDTDQHDTEHRDGPQHTAGLTGIRSSLACALAAGLIGARVGFQPALPVYMFLACAAVGLWTVDVASRRLPDVIILPSYGVAAIGFAVAAAVAGTAGPLTRAAAAGAVVFGAYAAACLLTSGSALGFGDAKLVGVLAISLGWAGWDQVAVAVLVAHLLAGTLLVALVVARQRWRGRTVAFGPYLLAGWAAAILLLPPPAP